MKLFGRNLSLVIGVLLCGNIYLPSAWADIGAGAKDYDACDQERSECEQNADREYRQEWQALQGWDDGPDKDAALKRLNDWINAQYAACLATWQACKDEKAKLAREALPYAVCMVVVTAAGEALECVAGGVKWILGY